MSYQISNTQQLGENTRNQTRDTFTDYRNHSLKDTKITYKNNNLNQKTTPSKNANILLPNYKWSQQPLQTNNQTDLTKYASNQIADNKKQIDLQSIKNNYNQLINQSTLLNTKTTPYNQNIVQSHNKIVNTYRPPPPLNSKQIRPTMSSNKDINNQPNTEYKAPKYSAPIFKPSIDDTRHTNFNKNKIFMGPENEKYQNIILKGPKLSKNQAIHDFEKNVGYTPEIGKKRQLSNIIFQSLQKKYQKFQKYNIGEVDIHNIMEKYGLFKYQENEHWAKSDLQNFVSELKKTMSQQDMYVQVKTPPIVKNELFEKETREIDYTISVDSKDRNIEKWPNPNEFRIEFAPVSDGVFNKFKDGFINRSFNNVVSIQLVSSIFPKKSCDGDNLEDYPYLILEIDEIGSNYEGTNSHTNKAFAKITFDIDCGKYKRFNSKNQEEFIKYFNPRRAISRLTLRVLKPNGELYNFGSDINTEERRRRRRRESTEKKGKFPKNSILSKKENVIDTIEEKIIKKNKISPEITFTFKVTCYKRALETMYLDRRDG